MNVFSLKQSGPTLKAQQAAHGLLAAFAHAAAGCVAVRLVIH